MNGLYIVVVIEFEVLSVVGCLGFWFLCCLCWMFVGDLCCVELLIDYGRFGVVFVVG